MPRPAFLPLAFLLAACAPAPATPAAAPASAPARAEVRLVAPPAAYALADAPTVHHWVAADVLQYVVELKRRTGANSFDASIASVTVPVKGAAAKTSAVFSNLAWGTTYRAYVTALGNNGGVVGASLSQSVLLPLNATPGTADFDFSSTQNVAVSLTKPVQVVFDATPFAGEAGLSFGAPADGALVNPGDPIAGQAE